MLKTRSTVIARVRGFLDQTGMSPHQFGIEAVGDHKFLRRLESGAGITLTVIEKAESYMDAYVPPPPASRQAGCRGRAA